MFFKRIFLYASLFLLFSFLQQPMDAHVGRSIGAAISAYAALRTFAVADVRLVGQLTGSDSFHPFFLLRDINLLCIAGITGYDMIQILVTKKNDKQIEKNTVKACGLGIIGCLGLYEASQFTHKDPLTRFNYYRSVGAILLSSMYVLYKASRLL